MKTRSLLVALAFAAISLSGCTSIIGGDSGGKMQLSIVDDGQPGTFEIEGVYAHVAGSAENWGQALKNSSIELTGGGGEASKSGNMKAASFDLLRVVFSSITVGDDNLIMSSNGIDLPVTFDITEGGKTEVILRFQWERAVFESQDGMAFSPTLRSLKIVQDGETILDQDAGELQVKDPNAPVARMRVLDEQWQVWEADFLAEDADTRKRGHAGNITFLGGASEALAPGATIAKWDWTFEDGVELSGQTVNRVFDLNGGNNSVTLVVTDSNGQQDDISLDLALAPGEESAKELFSLGPITGLSPGNGDACTAAETYTFAADPTMTPNGAAAGLASVAMAITAVAPHTGADVDYTLVDGESASIVAQTGNGANANLNKNYDPAGAQPLGGDWTITAYACKAYSISVSGSVTLTWKGVGNPEFLAWYAEYDDGENR